MSFDEYRQALDTLAKNKVNHEFVVSYNSNKMIDPDYGTEVKGINLVKDKTVFYLGDQRVNIHIPLPQITCSNWSDTCNESDNVGIIYKNSQITLCQLRYIVTSFEQIPSRNIHKLFGPICVFDGHVISMKEINQMKIIFEAVNKRRPKDNYGEFRNFKRDRVLVL